MRARRAPCKCVLAAPYDLSLRNRAAHQTNMKLKAEQLAQQLQRGLAPVYLIGGDEPLQVMEAAAAVRARARAGGCSERQVFEVERGFNWNELMQARASLSLFAEQRLLELRLPSGKPGVDGSKALIEYLAAPPVGDVLLIVAGKLERESTQAKWFGAIDQAGVVVQVWPVEAAHLPLWIERRMRARGLRPDAEAVALLAERVEGNLLACAQEIEKLALLHGDAPLDAAAVAAAVTDRTRAGDAAGSARVLHGLRGEGEEPVLVLWLLAREIRALAQMRAALAAGKGEEKIFAEHRIWDKRKAPVRAALKRHTLNASRQLLRRAAMVDRVAKGMAAGNVWDELLQLTMALAGAETAGWRTAR